MAENQNILFHWSRTVLTDHDLGRPWTSFYNIERNWSQSSIYVYLMPSGLEPIQRVQRGTCLHAKTRVSTWQRPPCVLIKSMPVSVAATTQKIVRELVEVETTKSNYHQHRRCLFRRRRLRKITKCGDQPACWRNGSTES